MNSKAKKKNLTVNLVFKNGAEKLLNELSDNLKEIHRLQSENNKLLKKGLKDFLKVESEKG